MSEKKGMDPEEFFQQVADDIRGGRAYAQEKPDGELVKITYQPETKMERGDFWEMAMQPNYPDEITLQIDRQEGTPGDITFSQEGVDEIAEQFRMFLMARIIGHQHRTGVMPHHLRINVGLNWRPGDPQHDPEVGPYFHIDADKGVEVLDHTRRDHVWRHS